MASDSRSLKARCLCGAATHTINPPQSALPITAIYCQCNSCRQMTGCLAVTSFPLLNDQEYQPVDELLTKLTAFEFSKDRISHYFCSTCGTHMLAHVAPRGGGVSRWWIMCGSLEDVRDIDNIEHIYVADTLDGGFANLLPCLNERNLERWTRHPQVSERLPLYWTRPELNDRKRLSTDKLRARCKCGGIEFWISRAANGSKFKAEFCACDTCRLANGMEWFVSASTCVNLDQISLDKTDQKPLPPTLDFGTLKTYRSSPSARRGFCSVCGATVCFFRDESDVVDISVGLLDQGEGAMAENWLEWSFDKIEYREDALARAETLTLAFEQGIKEFLEHRGKIP